jgi:hypothetical protein
MPSCYCDRRGQTCLCVIVIEEDRHMSSCFCDRRGQTDLCVIMIEEDGDMSSCYCDRGQRQCLHPKIKDNQLISIHCACLSRLPLLLLKDCLTSTPTHLKSENETR